MNIKLTINDKEIDIQNFIFSGGEVYVRIGKNETQRVVLNNQKYDGPLNITARIQNSDSFFYLANIKDALDGMFPDAPKRLFLPYLPYARQDRVCNSCESHSLKVFCGLLNYLKFDKVTVCDVHSDVSLALIDNLIHISRLDIINNWREFTNRAIGCVMISPDAGANKKTSEIAKYFNHDSFVRADKLRDLSTGEIKETIVYCDDFKGRDVLCADDIIDGGRTFIELAKVCKAKNCGKFVLYATHGIFSKSTNCLFDGGIDEIWTTNSFDFNKNIEINERKALQIFNVEKLNQDKQ
jgi:ribose-phosphate pyrophosphokinase